MRQNEEQRKARKAKRNEKGEVKMTRRRVTGKKKERETKCKGAK